MEHSYTGFEPVPDVMGKLYCCGFIIAEKVFSGQIRPKDGFGMGICYSLDEAVITVLPWKQCHFTAVQKNTGRYIVIITIQSEISQKFFNILTAAHGNESFSIICSVQPFINLIVIIIIATGK